MRGRNSVTDWRWIAFWTVLFAVWYCFPTEGAEQITISVSPGYAIASPFKSQTFRVLVRIQEHPDNRIMSFGADCGSNSYASQQDVEGIVYVKYYVMYVEGNCLFTATLHRMEKGKVKNYSTSYTANVVSFAENRGMK